MQNNMYNATFLASDNGMYHYCIFFAKSFSLCLNGIQFYWAEKKICLEFIPLKICITIRLCINFPATWEMAEK